MNTPNTPRLPIPELRYEHKDRLLRKERPAVASSRIWTIAASAAALVAIFTGAALMFFGATATDSPTAPCETIVSATILSPTPDTHNINASTQVNQATPQASLTQPPTRPAVKKRNQKTVATSAAAIINTTDTTPTKTAPREVLATINPKIEPINIDIQNKTMIRSRINNAYALSRQRMQQITFLDRLKQSITTDFNDFIEQVSASNPFQKQK